MKKSKGVKVYKNRSSVRSIVIIYVLIHLLFLSSNFIPDKNKYSASEFRSIETLSQYNSISLIRWDYAPKENTMEVVFDLTNTLYQEGTISMMALADNKQLDTKIVYSDKNMLIIQIYKVPKASGKRITVQFEYDENGNVTGMDFYTYVGIANRVTSLPVLSAKEYYYNRQVYDIAYYNSCIKDLRKEIKKRKERIETLKADLQRLKSETSNLTTDELLNLDETISNETQTITMLKTQITGLEADISTYQETIRVLEERRDAGESESREN